MVKPVHKCLEIWTHFSALWKIFYVTLYNSFISFTVYLFPTCEASVIIVICDFNILGMQEFITIGHDSTVQTKFLDSNKKIWRSPTQPFSFSFLNSTSQNLQYLLKINLLLMLCSRDQYTINHFSIHNKKLSDWSLISLIH